MESGSADVPLAGHVAVGVASLILSWSEAPLAKEVRCHFSEKFSG